MLFSQKEQLWKITDFGISTEVTSKNARTTEFSHGTASYRAPEILQERCSYNNRVDIWALGCILYELISKRKAFSGDIDVLYYGGHLGSLPIPLLPEMPEVLESHLYGIICELLCINPNNRPSAKETNILFSSYSLFLDPLHIKHNQSVTELPLYHDWRSFIRQHPTQREILLHIGKIYIKRNKVAAAAVGFELVQKHSNSLPGWILLCESVLALSDKEGAVKFWEEIINRLPERNSFGVDLLAFAYRNNDDFEAEVMAWEQLARLYPDDPEYLYQLSVTREGNVENGIKTSMSPLAIHPSHARLVWVSTDCEQPVLPLPSRTQLAQLVCYKPDDDPATALVSQPKYAGYATIGNLGRLAIRQPHLHYFPREYNKKHAIMKLEPCVIVHVAVIHSLTLCGCPVSFSDDHGSCKCSNEVRSLIIRRGTSCKRAYRDIAALHDMLGSLIRLWRFSFADDTTSCEPFLPDLVMSHASKLIFNSLADDVDNGGDFYEKSGSKDYLWLFLETRSELSPTLYLEWAQFSETAEYAVNPPILLFIKLFDVETQELGKQQVIYFKLDDQVHALVSTIFVTLKGPVADLHKISVFRELVGPRLERLNPELTFRKSRVKNGATIVCSKSLTSKQ